MVQAAQGATVPEALTNGRNGPDGLRSRDASIDGDTDTHNDSDSDGGLQLKKTRRPNELFRRRESSRTRDSERDDSGMRHGFEEEYNSETYLAMLEQSFFMYYTDKRHESGGHPKHRRDTQQLAAWRTREKTKTVSAALVMALNIGVDPPDLVKTSPCARLECWVDPSALPAQKSLELIGKHLQQQYETLSMRTRYKQYLDPSVEDTKKFCCQLRRNAKDERILFHYNGHGVPKPTSSGEIWVFNKNYTQYIPVSLYDLQAWLGAPCLYIYDCNSAGNIVTSFDRFVSQREQEAGASKQKGSAVQNGPTNGESIIPPVEAFRESIQLAACSASETLPMNPDLPADLFTCCLTSPIEIAVRWFVLELPLPSEISIDMVMKIPGRLQDRRTPLGELNWIFTAITDTIAWNMLPRASFKKLFRQDLMVAALFRNFLLAERIMRVHQCHPVSSPSLPPTHDHPMWDSWDLAVDNCLSQLPALLEMEDGGPSYEYIHSPFFTEQLTAFEVWLSRGAIGKRPPDQLPIVLQVLLSQVHRLRALILLSKFLDLGAWAVYLALSIGIFPYVLKLLQSPALELKPVLVFIWARILAVDDTCQSDLLKDNGYSYFVQILLPNSGIPISNVSEHRAMCAFILAIFCRGFKQGQVACSSTTVLSACLVHLEELDNPLLRQWACLCISELWKDYPEAKWQGIRESAHDKLAIALNDVVPEVRAACLVALTTFLGLRTSGSTPHSVQEVQMVDEHIAVAALCLTADGSSLVRRELVIFWSAFVFEYEKKFVVAACEALRAEHDFRVGGDARPASRASDGAESVDDAGCSYGTSFAAIWRALLTLSVDPYADVADAAAAVVDYIDRAMLNSPVGTYVQDMMKGMMNSLSTNNTSEGAAPAQRLFSEPVADLRRGSVGQMSSTSPSRIASTLRRSASIAASIKSLTTGNDTTVPRIPPNRVASAGHLENGIAIVSDGGYGVFKQPKPTGYVARRVGKRITLPLASGFFAWSCEYFLEPQMKPSEADEPGSIDYNQRLWRRNRNEKILYETQPQKELAGSSGWNTQIGFFANATQPSRLEFHQFEPHLVAADNQDGLAIWNWEEGVRLNHFSNANPHGTRITQLKFMNEDDVALLMCGSGEGIIRIYRNYESPKRLEAVSTWRALTDLLPSNRSSGLVAEWQQGRGSLLVGGDVKVIRVWDALREVCYMDIPARSGSCVTSLTSDQVAGNVFVAGFGDGAVRVYDRRLKPRDAMVKVWKEHKAWVTNVHMQRGGNRELISGCVAGDVRLWDIRRSSSIQCFDANGSDRVQALTVHEHAPVFATSSSTHVTRVCNTQGVHLSTFRHHSRFLQQQKSLSTTAITFHPHRMILACSGADHHVNLFATQK